MEKIQPMVSVTTLTYNNFSNIKETINSVYNQDYSNFEYIICDDGSDEFPEQYIRGLIPEEKKETFHIIRHPNVGTVANKNIALKMCQGEYVIGVAADDSYYDVNVISCIVREFQKSGADIVVAKRLCREKNGEMRTLPPQEMIDLIKSGDNEKILEQLYISCFLSGSTTYYSKKIIDKYGGFNENYRLIEDFPFYARILQEGGTISFLDKITINYGMDGVTSKYSFRTPSLLKNDRIRYYNEFIFPNIHDFSYLKKQELRFNYFRLCGSSNNIIYFFQLLTCLDFIIFKVIRKILGESKCK